MCQRDPRYPNARPRPARGTARRVLWILLAGGVAAAVVSALGGRAVRTVTPPPREQEIGRLSTHRLANYVADSGVIGGATAGQKSVAALRRDQDDPADPFRPVPVNAHPEASEEPAVTAPTARRPAPPDRPHAAVWLTRVRSSAPHPTREKALADALAVARDGIAREFRAMEPPVEVVPTVEQIRADYLRSVTDITPSPQIVKDWTDAKLDANRVWVEVDVEVSDDQVRRLRAGSRLHLAGLAGAGVFLVLLAGYGFLRLDALTRGYLTTGLAVTAAAAAGGGIALLFLVR